ncbi:hypothetical protein OG711_01715 [Streptomyces uncialis]|uniref:Uncharacterized protein n=1 Tax=Streptomyces uncialis TaxID=1048205 RepID=A0A1Q4V313_9ACTN|nr:hypothetical protein [Streptomyces uncialis]OKH92119.1 hypothetical protein AB852_24445 [Streptomyces uncialis]
MPEPSRLAFCKRVRRERDVRQNTTTAAHAAPHTPAGPEARLRRAGTSGHHVPAVGGTDAERDPARLRSHP